MKTYVYGAIVAATLVITYAHEGWAIGVLCTFFIILAVTATLFALDDEVQRYRTWAEDELGKADDELDEYDKLKALVAPLADPSSATYRKAIRALRTYLKEGS